MEIAWGTNSLVAVSASQLNSESGQGHLLFTSCYNYDMGKAWLIHPISCCRFQGCSRCYCKCNQTIITRDLATEEAMCSQQGGQGLVTNLR